MPPSNSTELCSHKVNLPASCEALVPQDKSTELCS